MAAARIALSGVNEIPGSVAPPPKVSSVCPVATSKTVAFVAVADDEEATVGAELGKARGCGQGQASLLDGMARVRHVPEEGRAGGAGGHEDRSLWVPGDADQAGLAGFDVGQLSFAGSVPQREAAVEARGGDDLGVGAEVDAPLGDDAAAEDVAVRSPGDGVPGEHAVVGEADGDELGAIGCELSDRPGGGVCLPSLVAMDNRLERPGECVEVPHGGFVGAGSDEAAVGEEAHWSSGRGVERKRLADRLLGRDVEDADRVVVGVRSGEQAAVGTECRGRGRHAVCSQVERAAPGSGGRIPEHNLVGQCGREDAAIGAEASG